MEKSAILAILATLSAITGLTFTISNSSEEKNLRATILGGDDHDYIQADYQTFKSKYGKRYGAADEPRKF